ncbi:sporulation membrane protein YtrI [Oceanobacillus sp. Castelsardo]|uniref:sporulation membrane protein YtrI n=1 Tax=Oceanobacillus sp. Castelsardo TaxID=1851204 RepID=UPI0008398F78|nr:sporulation membrane protein YtrI [Oceanobacillus sp. Castelsardo]
MHIPPYYKKPSWQRFFVGAVLGGIIAYVILLYMHGSMYESLLEENQQLKSKISELTLQNEALTKSNEDLNEKTNKSPIVESIEINIDNWEKYKLDRLTVYELEELVKDEINHLVGEKVSIVAESDFLLERAIENKSYKLNDVTYYFNTSKMIISETLKLTLEAKLTE